MHILILSSHLINLPSGLPLCRGQCEDQRRRPVCLWGAGGEDPADSRPVGEREPGPEDPAGQPAGGRRQSLWRLLLHTLNLPEEPMVHRKLIEMTQRTRIKWRWDGEGGRGVLMFARTFAVCTLPFFSTITCLQRETLNNSIVCREVHRFHPTSLCVWLCVIQQRGQFESIVAASLICRASG